MSKLAKVENGVVVNVIVGSSFPNYIPCDDGVAKGWLYESEVFTAPPVPEPPALTPEELNAGINAERERRKAFGCVVAVSGTAGIPTAGSDKDQLNIMGLERVAQLRLAAGDTTTVTAFRDRDNNMHDLTPMQIVELWQGGAAYIHSLYAASWALKALNPMPQNYTDNSHWPLFE